MGTPHQPDPENPQPWGYSPSKLNPLYKSFNGLSELEKIARKIMHLASLVFLWNLRIYY